ncbi:hypothetical protein D3C71_2155220 [compost metagenome]
MAWPRGARWAGAMQMSMLSMRCQPAHSWSTTAEDRAGTVLAPQTAVRPAAVNRAFRAAGKSQTKRRPSARSM